MPITYVPDPQKADGQGIPTIYDLSAKDSCYVGTTENITLAGLQTIDGVSVPSGARVLVKDQDDTAENGIWVAQEGAWYRPLDADSWDRLVGASTLVLFGDTLAASEWVTDTWYGGVLNYDAIGWTAITVSGSPVVPGHGIVVEGDTVHAIQSTDYDVAGVVYADSVSSLAITPANSGATNQFLASANGDPPVFQDVAITDVVSLPGALSGESRARVVADGTLGVSVDAKVNRSGDSMSGQLTVPRLISTGSLTGQDSATFAGDVTANSLTLPNAGVSVGQGQMAWNNTEMTVDVGMRAGSGVVLQLGQELHLYAVNDGDDDIADGQIVWVHGSSEQRTCVQLASAADRTSARAVIGMATQNIAKNQRGYITVVGIVHGLNTASIPEGSPLYLSTTPGGVQTIPPQKPNSVVFVGVCVKSHGSDGHLWVKPVDIAFFRGHPDVFVRQAINQDMLYWDTGTGVWKAGYPTYANFNNVTVNGTVSFATSPSVPILTTTSSLVLAGTHHTVFANTTLNNINVVVPSGTSLGGREYRIKKVAAANTLSIIANGWIDDMSVLNITDNYTAVTIVSDGAHWKIV